LWTTMTSPSIRRRRWRGCSHSEFESSFTLVYDVNLLKNGEMDVDLPTLFRVVGWSFVMRFWGSPLLVEGIWQIKHMMEG
jgi:hypothetical protein